MSLKLAELFISLSDHKTREAALLQDIADELSEGVNSEVSVEETPEEPEVDEAAAKKKAAAAKRKATLAKKKAEKEAAEAAEAEESEEAVDMDELMTNAQAKAVNYMRAANLDKTKTILSNCGVEKVSDAEGDAELLQKICDQFDTAYEELAVA